MVNGITNIKISGFKSIKDMDLKLGNINVLIGANGAGKSNFLDFLDFTRGIMIRTIPRHMMLKGEKSDDLLYFGSDVTQRISASIDFGKDSYSFDLFAAEKQNLVFTDEDIKRNGESFSGKQMSLEGIDPDDIEVVNDESILRKMRRNLYLDPVSQQIYSSIKSWKTYHFEKRAKRSSVNRGSRIIEHFSLAPDGHNLASMLYLLKNNEKLGKKTGDIFDIDRKEKYSRAYNKIVKQIKQVAPFFEDFVLEESRDGTGVVYLRWLHKNNEFEFASSDLSDGTLRFMCLATLLLQPDPPATIIIDEPELGLHPYAINILGGLMKSASVQTQIIVTTQSPILANSFKPEDIIVIDYNNDEGSKFRRQNSEELKVWLEDFEMGEIWEKNIIGGNP